MNKITAELTKQIEEVVKQKQELEIKIKQLCKERNKTPIVGKVVKDIVAFFKINMDDEVGNEEDENGYFLEKNEIRFTYHIKKYQTSIEVDYGRKAITLYFRISDYDEIYMPLAEAKLSVILEKIESHIENKNALLKSEIDANSLTLETLKKEIHQFLAT